MNIWVGLVYPGWSLSLGAESCELGFSLRTRSGLGGSGGARPVPGGACRLTRSQEVARFVHASKEQLESDDGINNDDEEHEQSDV